MPVRRQFAFPQPGASFPRETLGDVLRTVESIKSSRESRKTNKQLLKLNTMSSIMDRTMQIAKTNDATAKAYFDGAIKIANKSGIEISPDDITYIGKEASDIGEMSTFSLNLRDPQPIISGGQQVGQTGKGKHQVWMDDQGNIAKAIPLGETTQDLYTKALTKQVGKPTGLDASEKAMVSIVGKLEDQIKEAKKGVLKLKSEQAKSPFYQRGKQETIINEVEADIAFMEQRLVKIVSNLNKAREAKTKAKDQQQGKRTVKASSIKNKAKLIGKSDAELRAIMEKAAKARGLTLEVLEDK